MKKITAFLCLFISINTVAQIGNYKPAYIITNEGDTLRGQIDLRTNERNQKQCVFRVDETQNPTVYKPFDIQSFFFTTEGKYYVSKEIELNGEKIRTFIEFLVKGIMNLYYYEYDDPGKYNSPEYYNPVSNNIICYFFENERGEMVQIEKKPDKLVNGKLFPDLSYVGKTKYLLQDYNFLAEKKNKFSFNQKSFVNATKRYHEMYCTTGEKCIVYEKEKTDRLGLLVKISAYAGMNLDNFQYVYFRFISPDPDEGTRYEYNAPSFFPVVGADFDLIAPKFTKEFAIHGDISLSKVQRNRSTFYTLNKISRIFDTFSSLSLTTRAGIQYTYSRKKIYPLIGSGVFYSHLFTDKIRDNYFGPYVYLGCKYPLKNNHALFLKINYNHVLNYRDITCQDYLDNRGWVNYPDLSSPVGKTTIGYISSTLGINLGYEF